MFVDDNDDVDDVVVDVVIVVPIGRPHVFFFLKRRHISKYYRLYPKCAMSTINKQSEKYFAVLFLCLVLSGLGFM